MNSCMDADVASGAWKALCAGVMLQAVQRMETGRKNSRPLSFSINRAGGNCKEHINQKKWALQWIAGGVGTITFEDCCEALQIDADRARQMIERHCLGGKVSRRGRH